MALFKLVLTCLMELAFTVFVVALAASACCTAKPPDFRMLGNVYCIRQDPPLRHGRSCDTFYECWELHREWQAETPDAECSIIGISSDIPFLDNDPLGDVAASDNRTSGIFDGPILLYHEPSRILWHWKGCTCDSKTRGVECIEDGKVWLEFEALHEGGCRGWYEDVSSQRNFTNGMWETEPRPFIHTSTDQDVLRWRREMGED